MVKRKEINYMFENDVKIIKTNSKVKTKLEQIDMLCIYKNKGKFYNLYGIDSYIMNYLFNYKVLDNGSCGFPDSAFNKVINKLDENNISYQIIYYDKSKEVKDYRKLNNYIKFKKLAMDNMDLIKKCDYLIEKLKNASKEQIDKIINYIELCLE